MNKKYGIHKKTVLNKNCLLKKAYGSYDVVIDRFLCFAYTVIFYQTFYGGPRFFGTGSFCVFHPWFRVTMDLSVTHSNNSTRNFSSVIIDETKRKISRMTITKKFAGRALRFYFPSKINYTVLKTPHQIFGFR